MKPIWVHNGISARAKPFDSDLLDSYQGACIVLGTSRKAWTDLDEAISMLEFNGCGYDIMAINDIAHQLRKPIKHIVSTHKEIVGPLRQIRKVKMLEEVTTHSIKPHPGVDVAWGALTGNSGMFAALVAILLGYEKIIVCGIGMDLTGHYYDPVDPKANGSGMFRDGHRAIWREFKRDNAEASRVRVMSGTQMELYGRPDHGWINEKKESGKEKHGDKAAHVN